MGFEVKEKTINGYTYGVTQLGALKGRRVFTRFLKCAGPAIGALTSTKDLGKVFKALSEALSEDDVDYFCDAFLPSAYVTGAEFGSNKPSLLGVFDVHFAGRYLEFAQWLAFCFEVNFGSFFERAALTLQGSKGGEST